MPLRLALALLSITSTLSLIPSTQAAYSLKTQYAGDNFFDGWSFWGNRDNLTNGEFSLLLLAQLSHPSHLPKLIHPSIGAVNYVSEVQSQDLAYLNSAGNAIIKVDNSSQVFIIDGFPEVPRKLTCLFIISLIERSLTEVSETLFESRRTTLTGLDRFSSLMLYILLMA